MAAHDRLLQVPGEGSGLSQVMSPSAQEQLASVTSALELGNPAYGAIQSTLQVAPGDSRPSKAHLSGYSNGMVNPNVYDPAPSAGPEDVGSSRRAFPDVAAPIGEPHQERDGTEVAHHQQVCNQLHSRWLVVLSSSNLRWKKP